MVLSMPSPFKHPATGVYWYRQRVPARLASSAKGKIVTVTVYGHPSSPTLGADIKVSLRTKARQRRSGWRWKPKLSLTVSGSASRVARLG